MALIDGDSAAGDDRRDDEPGAPCDSAVTMNVGSSSSLRASARAAARAGSR
jgi:hypothetical protein